MGSQCAFGQVNRSKIENLEKNFDGLSITIIDRFNKLDKKNEQFEATNTRLYNHLSSRLPWWAMGLITTMGGIIGFLVRIVFSN